jgi:hypothetical protein
MIFIKMSIHLIEIRPDGFHQVGFHYKNLTIEGYFVRYSIRFETVTVSIFSR